VWMQDSQPRRNPSRQHGFRQAVVFATLMLPVALVHHLVHGMFGMLLVAGLCGVLVIFAALTVGPEPFSR